MKLANRKKESLGYCLDDLVPKGEKKMLLLGDLMAPLNWKLKLPAGYFMFLMLKNQQAKNGVMHCPG